MTDHWTVHICEVCFQPAEAHSDRGANAPLLPRCCPGCPCGSGDEAPDTEDPS